jgi:hypothetical protein
MQLHTGHGPRGPYDQRAQRRESPVLTRDGREFLGALARVTMDRIRLTLDTEKGRTMVAFWDRFRLRAPDAGRIMWAAGAMRWRNAKLQATAAEALRQDIDCSFNSPRYVTTALWGSAWAHPEQPLTALCEAVEALPADFWKGACQQLVAPRAPLTMCGNLTASEMSAS